MQRINCGNPFVSFSSVAAVSVDGNSRVYRESGAR